MGGFHRGHPVAHRFIHGFLEGGLSGGDGTDFGTHEPHAGHVQCLSLHVHLAHVNDALHAEPGADGGGGNAVLAGTSFCDDAFFTKAAGENDLTERVVDLVGSGVEQVFTFQIDFRAAELFGPAFCEIEWGRAAGVVSEEVIEFGVERGIRLGGGVGDGEILQRRHERFGYEHSTKLTEMTCGVG